MNFMRKLHMPGTPFWNNHENLKFLDLSTENLYNFRSSVSTFRNIYLFSVSVLVQCIRTFPVYPYSCRTVDTLIRYTFLKTKDSAMLGIKMQLFRRLTSGFPDLQEPRFSGKCSPLTPSQDPIEEFGNATTLIEIRWEQRATTSFPGRPGARGKHGLRIKDGLK